MATKVTVVAYMLWLVGGWIGLHHLYLHRPRAAFLSLATLQGWGVLWLYDLLTLPQLVAQANTTDEYLARLRVVKTFHATAPPLSLLTSLVQIVCGTQFGALAACLAPATWPRVVHEALFAVGTAWAIAFSGNAADPETRCDWKWVLLTVGGVVTLAFVYCGYDPDDDTYGSWKTAAVFLGVAAYLWTQQWTPHTDTLLLRTCDESTLAPDEDQRNARPATPRPTYWRTLLTYWSLVAVFAVCGTTGVALHGVVRVHVDGVVTETPFFEACGNFVRSEAFQMFTSTMYDLYQGKTFDEHFGEKWTKFNQEMDLSGRRRYLKVLGLSKRASEKEIKTAYRKLVLQWHPDKYTGDDGEHATAKFFQIQEAYEKLMHLSADRRDTDRAFENKDEL